MPTLTINPKETIMATPTLIIVGAQKGGVGKSFVARTLLDYYKSKGIDTRAIDTETPVEGGLSIGLKRFYADHAEVIDLGKSAGQMLVFDSLKNYPITLIDIRAGLLEQTLVMLRDTGFFDNKKFNIIVVHVLGGSVASYYEVKQMAGIITNARHLLVRNHVNDNSFLEWTKDGTLDGEVIDIKKLNEMAAEHVDVSALPFSDFIADVEHQSETLRGYVRHYLKGVFATYDGAGLNQLT
jgi:hypothetical protein